MTATCQLATDAHPIAYSRTDALAYLDRSVAVAFAIYLEVILVNPPIPAETEHLTLPRGAMTEMLR